MRFVHIQGKALTETKTLTMTFRLKPATKDGLKLISDRESRSIANSIEWLVKAYFESRGLQWPPEITTSGGTSNDRRNAL
jgi:hypothetical protein